MEKEKDIIIRYLNHECSAEELHEIGKRVQTDATFRAELFEAERIWNINHELACSESDYLDGRFHQLMRRIHEKDKHRHPFRLNTSWMSWRNVFAAACMIASVVFFLFSQKEDEVKYNTLIVPNGQYSTLVLSDGTEIMLNSGSELTYPSDFRQMENRDVHLKGEAYFKVRHNEEQPFIVHTRRMDVKVLGTTFNVKAYQGENFEVDLKEGRVLAECIENHKSIELHPKDKVILNAENQFILTTDSEDFSDAWTQRKIHYNNQTLRAICSDLSRRYDVAIRITDPMLGNDRYTCHTMSHISIGQVLDLLKQTKQIDYYQKNDTIYIVKSINRKEEK